MISSSGKNLIFLISQPRAGSTLLQLMLSGHPDIATTSEPWIALHPLFALRNDGVNVTYNSQLAKDALSDYLKQSGIDETFYKKQVAAFLLSFYNKTLEYQKKKIFLDKTPRYYHIVFELKEIFPEAKFLILFRNPLAVLNSIIKTWAGEDLLYLAEHRDDLIVAPEKLVSFTESCNENVFRLSYEEFIKSPEGVLQEVCKFLGISYTNQMLDYSQRLHPEWRFGDPVGVHKTTRPSSDSLERWKNGFDSPQKKLLALSYLKSLGPVLVKRMGYDYDHLESSIDDGSFKGGHNLMTWQEIMNPTKSDELESLKQEISCMQNSLSWRTTGPVRAVVNLIKKRKS